jgi:hypothetical protein
MVPSEAKHEQPLSELVGGIASDVETLVEKELTLTGQTIRDDLSTMLARAGVIVGAGVFFGVGILYLALGSALLLNQAMGGAPWAAFMIVGATSTAIAAIIGASGTSRGRSHG